MQLSHQQQYYNSVLVQASPIATVLETDNKQISNNDSGAIPVVIKLSHNVSLRSMIEFINVILLNSVQTTLNKLSLGWTV